MIARKLRTGLKLARVGFALAWSAGDYLLAVAGRPAARPRWLHRTSRRLLAPLGLRVDVRGEVPTSGLLVANHLSYLDIPFLAATTPCVFVAKREVAGWPVFGWFARKAGTLFVHRESRTQSAKTVDEIARALREGQLVVLFPEGTSSGGAEVLPFRSPLLQPAFNGTPPLHAAAFRYALSPGEGDPSEEVCYWKEMTLFPHLLNLLAKSRVEARLAFAPVPPVGSDEDRKALALRLHAEVSRLMA